MGPHTGGGSEPRSLWAAQGAAGLSLPKAPGDPPPRTASGPGNEGEPWHRASLWGGPEPASQMGREPGDPASRASELPEGSKSFQLCLFRIQIGPGGGGTPFQHAPCALHREQPLDGQQEAIARWAQPCTPKMCPCPDSQNLWIGPYLGICILIKLRILR